MSRGKIVHLCLCVIVTDGMTYQDNLLPKYHKRLGFDVTVVTSKWVYDSNGQPVLFEKERYVNEDGVTMVRLPMKQDKPFLYRLKRYGHVYETIEQENPDILFVHGCQCLDIDVVVRYIKRHRDVVVYVDNHADYSNSATNFVSKHLLHGLLWRNRAKLIDPYVKTWYGVLPARVDFLHERYGIARDKIKLLVMGIDDDYVQNATSQESVHAVREKYEIADDDFVIITGGKIDRFKTQTLTLMKAFHELPGEKLRLLVFGSVEKELQEEFNQLLKQDDRTQYIGWINGSDIYQYLGASDLAVYPGRHSVLWEQTVGLGIPAIFKRWDGTTHVDVGGNCLFLNDDSIAEMKGILNRVINEKTVYEQMKHVSEEMGMKVFSYENIAKQSVVL